MANTRRQVESGVKWVAIARISQRGIQLLSTMVLARLLVPEMFGLVGMTYLAIGVLTVFRELGFGPAFIQRRCESDEEERLAADTTFWLVLTLNSTLFVVAELATPLISSFFQAPGLEPLLRVMFLAFVIDGFSTVPGLILSKHLDFPKAARAEIAASVVQVFVSIPLALLGWEVWALVTAQLAARLTTGALFFAFSGWWPRLRFSRATARELFSFGKYMWAFSGLSAIGDIFDRILIGKLLGTASLGAYSMGRNLASLPAQQISFLINRVTFPAFSRMQGDLSEMARALRKVLSHVAMISLPIAAGMLATSEDLIYTVYGNQWTDAIPVLEVLAFYGLTLSVSSVTGPVFQAMGKPQVLLYTSLVHHATLFSGMFLLASHGAVGIAWAVVIPVVVSAAIAFVLIVGYLACGSSYLLAPVLRAAGAALLMYFAVVALREELLQVAALSRSLRLLCLAGAGVGIYGALSLALNREVSREVLGTARAMIAERRREA